MSTADIEAYKINQRITITRVTSPDEPEYYSVIQDIKNSTLYITTPYQKEDPLVLMRNEQVRLKYITSGAAFVFTAPYLGVHQEESLRLYKIKEPFLEDIERIQLRRFVRVEVMMDVEYRQFDAVAPSPETLSNVTVPAPAKRTRRRQGSVQKDLPEPETDWKKATILDISGGGMRMILKEKLETGVVLNIHFKIFIKKENINMNLKTAVIRCNLTDGDTKLYQASLKFLDIDRNLEDSLCAFVFAKQMEQIRKQ
ncbi:MAG: flagellar brake domain-containing protein [Desulfotomaculum sp.]|nr:flagellar brake domain-containing protein [Desulfotomaculum sp.]